ncbi:hypothetical protein D3C81_1278030 [compost metagenome]
MEVSNLEKYRKDLKRLLDEGHDVSLALLKISYKEEYLEALVRQHGGNSTKAKAEFDATPAFEKVYQHWYSQALPVVKLLLPDRHADFIRLYERPKARKELTFANYRIEDACQRLRSGRVGGGVDTKAAVNLLDQQIAIVEAIERRFDSSLFDIRQMVQADLLDNELDSAKELLKNRYARAAGALAGVVLEGHLKEVCDNHGLAKKSGTIAVLNDALKAAGVIELSQHRYIQLLGDLRNKCSHKNAADPTTDDVTDLINGVDKVIKTVF